MTGSIITLILLAFIVDVTLQFVVTLRPRVAPAPVPLALLPHSRVSLRRSIASGYGYRYRHADPCTLRFYIPSDGFGFLTPEEWRAQREETVDRGRGLPDVAFAECRDTA